MQGTNANNVSSFGGSLIRKSSQKTYGRRGRAHAAVKEHPARDQDGTERREQQALDASLNGGKRESDIEVASHDGVSASMDEWERPTLPVSTDDRVPYRKRSRREEDDRLENLSEAAPSGIALTELYADFSDYNIKRQKVGSDDKPVTPPRPDSTKPVPHQSITPSSELSELPSESEDTDVENTPKAIRPQPAPKQRNMEQELTKQQEITKQQDRLPTNFQTNAKAGRAKQSVPITPPTSTTFLPAISSTGENSNGAQPIKFPARKKTRMLSRAESFGRQEAQKDQQEPITTAATGTMDPTTSVEQTHFEEPSKLAPTACTVPATPRRSLVRSSTLASWDVSPSKQRSALARTTSMPLSPVKNSVIVSTQIPEPGRNFGVAGNGVPARRTYGKAQRFNLQVNEVVSQPPPVADETTQLSPIPQSSVSNSDVAISSPSRPLLETRESYADLVKRLEMDDNEELQDREEQDGSMDYLRNAQSLAELRSKGENRKFMDDLTWLLDGLSEDVFSVRRSRSRPADHCLGDIRADISHYSSAIDVLNKMSAPGWFEKLRICSQVEEIYTRLDAGRQRSTDIGYDLAILEYVTYIARVPNALMSILGNHRDNVITFALHVLRTPSVTFNVTATNDKRKPSPALSADAMAMAVISVITGHSITGHIEPPDAIMQELICTAIVEGLRQCLKILPERMELFEKGLELFPDGTDVNFAFIAEAIETLSAIRNAWPVVRASLESYHSGLATDFGNLLLVMQFVDVPLLSEKEDLGEQRR
ncbi:hypothetical protein QFC21_003582 [Naganishia friedmannii]|uniref:Uncharacterized protein n=1 Tax=Naganishia friedmannii TaxID=89922 RepID=A0ACC2VM94_9TREE|nr:hypothetical protein QFC21_003582 [Naganishia friedmannii]